MFGIGTLLLPGDKPVSGQFGGKVVGGLARQS